MKSLWKETANQLSFEPLKQDIKTDVLIIGGGMAGILCAYMLQQAGIPYVLAEAQTICSQTTQNTTAKITSQHGLIYHTLLEKFGLENAQLYLRANQEALQKYRELCQNIPCDFEQKDAYVYSLDNRQKIEKEVLALQKLGYPAQFSSKLALPFNIAGAVKFPNQAQFHPLKFALSIAKGLHIYEHTKVLELIGTTAVTNRGRIYAQKIIVATHFPFLNKHGSYFLKMYQHRSYVLALKNAPNIEGMYVDEKENGMSFRNYQDLLLLGGADHRTGKKSGAWGQLRSFVQQYYPHAEEICHWAAQDCMPLDQMAYIGPYSARTKNLYVATGFHKWGMTSAMVAAMLLCDLVQEKPNPYAQVFSPSRSMLHLQLGVNALEATIGLLTPFAKRCPHMGCALKWNPHEHTWDCPCHGSRFAQDGSLLDNPATGDMKK